MSIILKPKTINKGVAKFVINNLPTISGDPYYESLNEMIQALYSNAGTLPTTVAGVKYGHVGLIIKDTLYATLVTVIPWEDSDDPVSIPTIDTNATSSHCQQANETYGEACRIFENYATMDEELKHQLVETI